MAKGSRQIRKALPIGCGGVPVRAGGRNGEHRLSGQGAKALLLIVGAGISDAGCFVCLLGTSLSKRNSFHDAVHPKATVQAAIGGRHSAGTGLPAAILLTVAVLSC